MRDLLRRLFSPTPPSPPVAYRDLVAPLPRPTAQQTDAFVEYVARAHSWYKHLPTAPPGAPFVVFLDPNAGRALVRTADGRTEYRDRDDERDRFHHTWMFTREYREQFGHWHYATDQGTQFVVRVPGSDHTQVLAHGLARVATPDGREIDVPPDLAAAGTVHLTAHVHSAFCADYLAVQTVMLHHFHAAEPRFADHGRELIELHEAHERDPAGFDREIQAERARQRAELRAALDRVLALLAATSASR